MTNRAEKPPSRLTRRFLESELKAALLDFLDFGRRTGITLDYSVQSLETLDSIFPCSSEEYRRAVARFTVFKYDGSPLSDWLVALGTGSYFGEVLIRTLGGRWKFPSRIIVFYCFYTDYLSPIFRHWYVVVGRQKIPVFDIARRRLMIGQEESLARAFREIASAEFNVKSKKVS